MPFKTIRTFTRPNIYIPFYIHSDEIRKYIDETYNQTGKRISVNTTLSEDGLQQITTSVWQDRDTWKEFVKDPTIVSNGGLLSEYNTAFEIVASWDNSEVE
jgi:hypothetical protein